MIKLNFNKEVKVTHFPDGTGQVWKLDPELLVGFPEKNIAAVIWSFESESELLYLAQLKALLDTTGRKTKLTIQYLPYARQDKEVSNDATFGLYPFAKLLNSLKFDIVSILDPHSTVALDLIENSYATFPEAQVNELVVEDKIDILCFPDKGAQTKYASIYPFVPNVFANKIREQSTGLILETTLNGSVEGKRVLIVDDICDGGATFTSLSKVLKDSGASYVGLYVTHGIFSKGIQVLLDAGIDKVSYTHLQGEAK